MFGFRGVFATISVIAVTGAGVAVALPFGPFAPTATAAGSTTVEADSMTVSPGFAGTTITDATASGGKALALGSNSKASKNVVLDTSATVVVRARGPQCNGVPNMTVTVDGVNVGTAQVATNVFADYRSSVKVAAGAHTVSVAFTNQYWSFTCSRRLIVDTVTVVPDGTTPTTSTTPTTTTPAPANAAPRGNLPGWTHAFADDFSKAAATGSWNNGTDPDKIVYVGDQGQQWRTYPSTYVDTYQRRPYRPAEVLSVANGMLKFDLHNVQGQPAGANPSPIIANGSQYQTYGRYSARLKVDTPSLSEYHIAWLLWPKSERWPQDGEIDFPEGQLNETAGAFHHYARTAGGQDAVDTGKKFTDWHTYTIEWSPGRVRFLLDDAVVMESTQFVPSTPMRWQLQTETNGTGTNRGNLLVDWVSIWSYAKP